MEQFLIGTGLALLLALIAWSDQIRSLRKDTEEAEKYLYERRGLNWRHVRLLIRKKAPAEEILAAINKILKEKSNSSIAEMKIIYTFNNLDNKRRKLERLYNTKYHLILILTFLFFVSGISEFFINDCKKIEIMGIKVPVEFLPVFFCILFSLAILCFIIHLNKVENNYRDEFINIMDEI